MRVPVVYDRYSYADCVEFSLSDINEEQMQKAKEFLHSLPFRLKGESVSFYFSGEIKFFAFNEGVLVQKDENVQYAKLTVYINCWHLDVETVDGNRLETVKVVFSEPQN